MSDQFSVPRGACLFAAMRIYLKEKARQLRSQGQSARQVAQELGVSPGTVQKWTRGVEGAPKAGHPPGPITNTARMIELRSAGNTVKAIAVELGVSVRTVTFYTKDVSGKTGPGRPRKHA